MAPGTPGRAWAPAPEATVELDPSLSHDGAEAAQIPPGVAAGGSISTNAVAGRARIGVMDRIEVRQVVLPGDYRILNDGGAYASTAPPYVDAFALTPLQPVSLREALDAPDVDFTANGGGVVGWPIR